MRINNTAVLIFCFYLHRDMSLFPSLKGKGFGYCSAAIFHRFIQQRMFCIKYCTMTAWRVKKKLPSIFENYVCTYTYRVYDIPNFIILNGGTVKWLSFSPLFRCCFQQPFLPDFLCRCSNSISLEIQYNTTISLQPVFFSSTL